MKKRANIAACSFELPEGNQAPDWVHLLPMGRFTARDGRGPWQIRDRAHAERIVAATRQLHGSGDIPGDYEHQLLHAAENGKPAPASGWIKDLQVRVDGIWGRVEWTAKAAASIVAREYRYLSPVFGYQDDGSVTRLRAFGLTNAPALELTAIASQHFSEPEEDTMDPKLLAALLALTGLQAGSTEDQIAAACQKLADDVKATKASIATIAKALGQAENATGEAIAAAAQELATKAKATDPDPAKFVPIKAFEDLQEKVAAMSQQLAGDKVAAAVAEAKAAGKLAPAMEDWAKAYAAKDLDGFVAWCKAQPVIVAPSGGQGGGAKAAPPAGAHGDGLNAEEIAVCRQLGLTEEQFKKEKAAAAA